MINSVSAVFGAMSAARPSLPTANPPAVGGADFGSVLANVSADAVKTIETGEAAAISGLQSKATVQEVVSAIMAAEQTLQAALAIRDKVVSAYQEISRMQI